MKLLSDERYKELLDADEVYNVSLRSMQKVIDRYHFDLNQKREEINFLRQHINELYKEIEDLKQEKERYRKIAYDIDTVRKQLMEK